MIYKVIIKFKSGNRVDITFSGPHTAVGVILDTILEHEDDIEVIELMMERA